MEMCYAVAFKYLRDSAAAQDAVMEIFEEIAHSLQKHEVKNFRGWLYTVARNHCLIKIRSARNTNVTTIDENLVQLCEQTHHDVEGDIEIRIEKMDSCIKKLNSEQRTTIEMFYKQGKCYNEISTITGYDWSKVRSLIQNGRRNLKICIERTLKIDMKN